MRFMVLVKATNDSEAGVMPSAELLTAMGKFNEELSKAGILLDLSGLHPSPKGARVRFSGSNRTVIDGPFAETKELISGYWLIQVKSKEEAIEWVKRCPNPHNVETEIEIRQVFELSDFTMTPEAQASHDAVAARLEAARESVGRCRTASHVHRAPHARRIRKGAFARRVAWRRVLPDDTPGDRLRTLPPRPHGARVVQAAGPHAAER